MSKKDLPNLLALFFSMYILSGQEYYFKHYKVENGLSHNTVLSSLQDSKGFIWFGTKDGLNRFDGYSFKYFQNDSDDPKSLGSNFVECLHEYGGQIWVGTDSGLFHYNELYENFEILDASQNRPVLDIEHDTKGNLWYIAGTTLYKHSVETNRTVGYDPETYFHAEELTRTPDGTIWAAYDNFIYRYNEDSDSFKTIEINSIYEGSLPLRISKISPLDEHTLLIGTQNHGAILFDIQTEITESLLPASEDPLYVRDFAKRTPNELWMATESGIYIYHIKNGTFKNLKKNYNDPYALSDNAVYTLTVDKEGGIWMGTYFGGADYYPKQYTQFDKYYPKSGENAISGNAVREIHPDQYGNLWIGTEDAGLNKFNPETGVFTNYKPTEDNQTLAHYNIHALLPRGDKLWIGTFEHGLDIMDIPTGKIINHYSIGDGHGLSSNFVFALYENPSREIFAITASGIQLYDNENDKFLTLEAFPEGIFFTSMIEDANGILWAGTYWNGLFYYNPKTKRTGIFKHDGTNPNSISSNAINGIFLDSKNNLWVTTENGLNLYLDETRGFKKYTTKDGFPSNVFYSIIEDSDNHLWISTSNGLINFNPGGNKLKVFTKSNGLLSDQFNYNSAYKAENGTMYFGSVRGMISFDPDKFTSNAYKPPILITGLQINNKDVPVDKEGSPLPTSVTFTDKIELSPDESSFSLDFAALSYTAPEMTEYWYKLDGLNDDWVYLKKNHKVYFTELSAGEYSFKVKSLNSSGIWSEEAAALHIKVLPTFLKSNAAYSIYIILIGLIGYLAFRYYHSRTKAKNYQIIKELNNKKEKELFRAKIEFFTNISHEIRTPLTLIKSPLEKILKRVENGSELQENLSIMEKNTSRLLDLTNQLLDFRKTEFQDISLSFIEINISDLLRNTYERFSQAVTDKNLTVHLQMGTTDVYAYIDAEATRKILSNLLGNAIKYSEKRIIITLEANEEFFELKVKNDGKLIPSHLQNKIFEPFYRVPGIENENQPGTGIGLSLAHSLTEMHNGSLKLDSSDGDLNVFVLRLPIHQEKEFSLYESNKLVIEERSGQTPQDPVTKGYKPAVLLVEDNEDLLDFVAKDLTDDYLVIKAVSAEKALEMIADENIHLVVSDVMMPGMDGFSFCEKIKTDLETSHIPVILLTSKSAMTARIEGLESGADAYIEKPFSMEYLKVQISNLIENRKHIMEHYSSSPLAHIRSIAHTRTDEKFIKKLDQVIYGNISDPDLNVETLADIMNMSRSTLYRKIKEMSNLSPNELVNIARLKKAAELLKKGDYKIYEIAEMVGYNSQTSFGRNFQKQFSMTPTEYMKVEGIS